MRKAFTLAEVLITLAIIGIVAALTIPSVISNYQQMEFKTGLRKAVSVLNSAIQTNIAVDGETPYDNQDLMSYLQRHMSTIKNIDLYTCLNEDGSVDKSGPVSCSGSSQKNLVFYTTDGMRFEYGARTKLKLYENNTEARNYFRKTTNLSWIADSEGYTTSDKVGVCGSYGLNDKNGTLEPPCIITVDVNGDKKPNYLKAVATEGSTGTQNATTQYTYPSPSDKKLSDIFNILITEEKAIPFGVVAQRAMYSK